MVRNNIAAFLLVWSSWSLLDLTLSHSPVPEIVGLLTAAVLLFPWRFVWEVLCVRVRSTISKLPDEFTPNI